MLASLYAPNCVCTEMRRGAHPPKKSRDLLQDLRQEISNRWRHGQSYGRSCRCVRCALAGHRAQAPALDLVLSAGFLQPHTRLP